MLVVRVEGLSDDYVRVRNIALVLVVRKFLVVISGDSGELH